VDPYCWSCHIEDPKADVKGFEAAAAAPAEEEAKEAN
jgi:hypothetical protein